MAGQAVPTTPDSVTLEVGDYWQIGVFVVDEDGSPATATVTVTVTTPSGTFATPTAFADGPGYYLAEYLLAANGRHIANAVVSDVGAVPFTAWAGTVTPASGFPDVDDVRDYLGDTSATDADLADALAAETSAQRARCRIPAVYPDDLAQALKRRVARNLAARSIPVASFTSFEGGGTATSRVPQVDAEIARFEGPYRKRRVG